MFISLSFIAVSPLWPEKVFEYFYHTA